MTYIQIGSMHTGDARWLDAGPDAFTLHVWAASWCDQQLTNGRIPKVMAQRVALPVPPERVAAAIKALLDAGFWEEVDGAYQLVDYFSWALSAEEIRETQDRWKRDKQRQRMHANGNHSACDSAKCRGAMSTKDSSKDSSKESAWESSPYTQPNSTQPNPTEGRGFGGGGSTDAATPPARRQSPEEDDGDAPGVAWQTQRHPWGDDGSGISCDMCSLPEMNHIHDAPDGCCQMCHLRLTPQNIALGGDVCSSCVPVAKATT